ncbi:MAG: hypothetical protein ACFFA6_06700 [Promethearchaeota archaeon]
MSKAVSSNSVSFYDWELSFKKNASTDQKISDDKMNKLGINDDAFKDFMKKWKERNFS